MTETRESQEFSMIFWVSNVGKITLERIELS